MKYGELWYESHPKSPLKNLQHRKLLLFLIILGLSFQYSSVNLISMINTPFLIYILLVILLVYSPRIIGPKICVYDSGIFQQRMGNKGIFYSYQDVKYVECIHYRYKSRKQMRHEELLVFWFSDATYITLKIKNKDQTLKPLWNQLISQNPELISRLICCVNDAPSRQLYQSLNELT